MCTSAYLARNTSFAGDNQVLAPAPGARICLVAKDEIFVLVQGILF